MSTEAVRNMIHREVLRVFYRFTRRTPCIVDGYNPAQHTVKLRTQPEDKLTGWTSIQIPQVGYQMAPNIGDPGWLEYHEADRRAAVFVGSNHNDQKPPPAQIQAGEFRYQHSSGSFLYFKNDGSVTWKDKAGVTHQTDGEGNLTVTVPKNYLVIAENIAFDGNVSLGGGIGTGEPAGMQGSTDTHGDALNGNLAQKVKVQ